MNQAQENYLSQYRTVGLHGARLFPECAVWFFLGRGPTGRALAAMLVGGRESPAVATAVRKRWLQPRRDWARMRLAWAAEAGQLRDGVEPRPALALLYSPLYSPLLFGNDIPSRKDLAACFDLAAQAIFVTD